jgi:mannan endo-1,4-beta-mannosidase
MNMHCNIHQVLTPLPHHCCVISCRRVYKDDPTIIAWNLINEPRCESWLASNKDCNKRFQNWLADMSTHVRSLDPNHLITIGSEGFYGDSTPQLMQYNPQAWARELGQDFVMNTNLPNIDFATVHAWPDNWMLPQVRLGGGSIHCFVV